MSHTLQSGYIVVRDDQSRDEPIWTVFPFGCPGRLHAGNRFAAFLIGWGILRGVALIPVLGALAFLAAVVFGLGALTWTLLQARDGAGPAAAVGGAGGPESPTAPAI